MIVRSPSKYSSSCTNNVNYFITFLSFTSRKQAHWKNSGRPKTPFFNTEILNFQDMIDMLHFFPYEIHFFLLHRKAGNHSFSLPSFPRDLKKADLSAALSAPNISV